MENVLKNINSVSNEWCNLGAWLGIPGSTMKKLFAAVTSESDEDGLAAVIKEWLEGGGSPPTWRTLFWALYNLKAITIAERIGQFAEPIKGACVIPQMVYC